MKEFIRYYLVTIMTFVIISDNVVHSSETAIVADHSVVEQYSQIPDQWIDSVKTMLLCYPGESHGTGLMYGFELLENIDNRFAVNVNWTGEPEGITSDHLRACRTYRNLGNSGWKQSGGEEDFFTSQEAVDMMLNNLNYCQNAVNNPVSAFGFGWCWDMSWLSDVNSEGWAGRLYYPVNKSNYTDNWDTTTTTPCLEDYIDVVNAYNSNYPQTVTFFSTGPVDGGDNTRSRGYQRWLKNEYIRNKVNNSIGISYLFDYADIICWNDENLQNTIIWDGHSYPYIHSDYEGNYDGGHGGCHINDDGCLRLAKSMWWLLARMAGWNNTSASIDDSQVINEQIPKELTLAKNYPNPFNPTTIIRYGLPSATPVVIEIYNMLGQKITTLVNENKAAGYYELKFSADQLASGIYIYTIHAGEYNKVMKMVVMK
jgi:hypothetical protein